MLKIYNSYHQIIYSYSMSVLVNYHMDTFFGIGRVSHQSIYMVGIHVQVDMYTERGGGDIIWGIW